LWRDLGYAIGAILTGLIADRFGLIAPVAAIGLLTILSSLIVRYRMSCHNKSISNAAHIELLNQKIGYI
jgi:predicted MFS family arabinose efflux permease